MLAIVFCFVATGANAEKQGIVCENGICRIVPIVRVWAVQQPTPAPIEMKPAEVVSEPQVMHRVLIHREVREVQPVRNVVSHCSEHKPVRGLLKRIFGRR
jgi:hypothetical protein